MEKNLYIDASNPNETRVVLKSKDNIEDYEYEGSKNNLIKNNIYLGKVSRIEPSLQAAFIDFGRERHGFLSFNDIQSDYYQIPKADLEKIKQEEEKAREELSKQIEAKEEENIAEGKLEIDDPIEKGIEEQIDDQSNGKENIPTRAQRSAGVDDLTFVVTKGLDLRTGTKRKSTTAFESNLLAKKLLKQSLITSRWSSLRIQS